MVVKNVQQIQTTFYAFAAILGDGSVMTWGDVLRGLRGDHGAAHLRGVGGAFPWLVALPCPCPCPCLGLKK